MRQCLVRRAPRAPSWGADCVAPTASAPIKLRDQRVTAADIEALMAATDATVERVMANVSKIVKPSAKEVMTAIRSYCGG